MARSTHAEPAAFPEIENGLTPAEVTVGLLVEFANLGFETPAQRRKLAGVWRVREIGKATAGRPATFKVENPTGSVYRGLRPDMVKRTALTWPEAQSAPMVAGVVVKWTPEAVGTMTRGKVSEADRFVVIADKVADVAIVKVGGDEGRYFPKVPKARLVVVPGSWVDADA
jgi:hypothetical protein